MRAPAFRALQIYSSTCPDLILLLWMYHKIHWSVHLVSLFLFRLSWKIWHCHYQPTVIVVDDWSIWLYTPHKHSLLLNLYSISTCCPLYRAVQVTTWAVPCKSKTWVSVGNVKPVKTSSNAWQVWCKNVLVNEKISCSFILFTSDCNHHQSLK